MGMCVMCLACTRAQLVSVNSSDWQSASVAVRAPSPEAGETLAEAGLRELFEETGLELRGGRLVVDTLGLWESVYPHLLSAGDPRRHHLVVYLHVVVPQPADEILQRLKVSARTSWRRHGPSSFIGKTKSPNFDADGWIWRESNESPVAGGRI